ncbi:MAG: PAS domain-containing protein, partial [Clostridia bacterium]
MKNRSEYTENLLNDHISGFHRYDLRGPARLTFVSRNFCEMTGYGEEELLSDTDDLWAAKIHPNDRRRYEEALRRLAEGEKTVTIQYRARRKDGGFCFLSDTLSAGTDENGAPAAYSVLSDITPLRDETAELRFFDETATGGFLRYTCEEKPKITYMNESLRRMLRFSADTAGFDDFELYRDNIYLLIPPEDRGGFARFLEKIVEKDAPAAGEMNFLRCDGTRGRLFGWVTKCVNDQGEEEFQSVLLDVTESYNERKERRTKQYRKALADVYDKVFEYDFVNRTVKYIYGSDSDTFGKIRNIPMDLEKATEQWLRSAVAPEDREKVHAFFRERILGAPAADGRPPQIRFGLLADNGSTRAYRGSFLWISSAVSFFCCRRVSGAENAAVLRDENLSLRHINENMQELVMQFTDGIVAFKVEKGNVRPLYASDNLCDFFGYTREEWLSLAREEHSIESFIAKSGVAPNDIEQLLCDGEAEFVYIDGTSGLPRRIKVICSRNSDDPDAPCYVLLSHMEEEESGK